MYICPLRKLHSEFNDVGLKHGFGTKRSEPTPYIKLPGADMYWRDVTSRSAMSERFSAFFDVLDVNLDKDAFSKACLDVEDLFIDHYGYKENKPVSIIEAISLLPTDTSAGLPFVPGTKKGEVRNQLMRLSKKSWRTLKNKHFLPIAPARAGARRALREIGENKPRLVFAYPGYLNVLESQFSAFIMKDPPKFIGWSVNWLDGGDSLDDLAARIRTCNSWANLDFSKFDTTVGSFLIRAAFNVFRSLLDLSNLESEMLSQLEEYFIHTPLLLYNQVKYKHRGIPSGSGFTQLIGSICNMIACRYACAKSDELSLIMNSCIWLGDDSFLCFDSGVARDEFDYEFLRHFKDLGLVVNDKKSLYQNIRGATKLFFLGRTFYRGYRYLYCDLEKLPAQIIIPENKDKCPEDAAQRIIGLAWAFGMNSDAYRILLSAWVQVRPKIDLSSVHLISRETLRLFDIFNITNVDLTHFPTYDELCTRFYGYPLEKPYYIYKS